MKKSILFAIALVCSSCATIDFMPAKPSYVPNVSYVNSFSEKGEFESHAYVGLDHIQGHFAYSVTNHVSVFSAVYLNSYNPWFLEGGASLFHSFKNDLQISCNASYGYGESHFYRDFYYQKRSSNEEYHKITTAENFVNRFAIQPSVTFNEMNYSISFSTRFSFLYFPYYYYDQYEYNNVYNHVFREDLAHFEKRNKKSFTIDPSITIKRSWGNFNIMAQLIYALVTNEEDRGYPSDSHLVTPYRPIMSWGFGIKF